MDGMYSSNGKAIVVEMIVLNFTNHSHAHNYCHVL